MFDESEYNRLSGQLKVLKEVLQDYPTASVRNAVQQIEARIKEIEKTK